MYQLEGTDTVKKSGPPITSGQRHSALVGGVQGGAEAHRCKGKGFARFATQDKTRASLRNDNNKQ